jgi:antitoxin component YwqK of YwqJK toxin-antitoxin module
MNGMEHVILYASMLLSSLVSEAQIIHFHRDPGTAEAWHRCVDSGIGYCVDSLRIDTIYTKKSATAELEMQIQKYPLARYEFYTDGALFRRIDIRQVEQSQETSVEDLKTGEAQLIINSLTEDVPNGAYHEFFPNGNIRIKGTLDGYKPDGTLKKTGTWMEWDAAGNVIREEHYP